MRNTVPMTILCSFVVAILDASLAVAADEIYSPHANRAYPGTRRFLTHLVHTLRS